MQKMIYKKDASSEGEVVWMLNAYRSSDGKLKAVIMRNHHGNSWDNCNPYDEVKLTKLRPTTEYFNNVFAE